MTAKQQILKYLTDNRFTAGGYTPTQIGQSLGKEYKNASAWVAGPLKQLVKDGSVKRIVPSPGVVKYFVEVN